MAAVIRGYRRFRFPHLPPPTWGSTLVTSSLTFALISSNAIVKDLDDEVKRLYRFNQSDPDLAVLWTTAGLFYDPKASKHLFSIFQPIPHEVHKSHMLQEIGIAERILWCTHLSLTRPSTRDSINGIILPTLEAYGLSRHDMNVCVCTMSHMKDHDTWRYLSAGTMITASLTCLSNIKTLVTRGRPLRYFNLITGLSTGVAIASHSLRKLLILHYPTTLDDKTLVAEALRTQGRLIVDSGALDELLSNVR